MTYRYGIETLDSELVSILANLPRTGMSKYVLAHSLSPLPAQLTLSPSS